MAHWWLETAITRLFSGGYRKSIEILHMIYELRHLDRLLLSNDGSHAVIYRIGLTRFGICPRRSAMPITININPM